MSQNLMENRLQLTAVFVEDPDGGYTGYFAEFPEAIAEGETEEQVTANLLEALKTILEYKREESQKCDESGMTKRTKSFNLELA